MGQARKQQNDRTSAAQNSLRALVHLLGRAAAHDLIASSSSEQTQEDRADALQHPRRS